MTVKYSDKARFAKALNIERLLAQEAIEIISVEGEELSGSYDNYNSLIPAQLTITFSNLTPALFQQLAASLRQLNIEVCDQSFGHGKNANVLHIQNKENVTRLFVAAGLCSAKTEKNTLEKSSQKHGWFAYSGQGAQFIRSNRTGKIIEGYKPAHFSKTRLG